MSGLIPQVGSDRVRVRHQEEEGRKMELIPDVRRERGMDQGRRYACLFRIF